MTTTDHHLPLVPMPPCYYCKKSPADDRDGMCTSCRAQRASIDLTQSLTDTLEIFLDARWSPHRFDRERPSYYLDAPAFDDDSVFDGITAAYDQIVAGAQRLIELAIGRPVVTGLASATRIPTTSWGSMPGSTGVSRTRKRRNDEPHRQRWDQRAR